MKSRIRWLDKFLTWILMVAMIFPNILNLFAYRTVAAIETDSSVQTVIYDGYDGSATVQAHLDLDEHAIHWTIDLVKKATEEAAAGKIEIDPSGGGLSQPKSLGSEMIAENKGGILHLRQKNYTKEAQTTIFSFSTDIADSSLSTLSLKIMAKIATEEAMGETNIHTSPHTKTVSLSAPIPETPQILSEEESDEIPTAESVSEVESKPEEAPVEEEPEQEELPAEQESKPQAEEEIEKEEEAAPEKESGKEAEKESEKKEEVKKEEAEKESSPQESAKEEPKEEAENTPEDSPGIPVDEIDPNIAEPVPNDYVNRSFSPTISLPAMFANKSLLMATKAGNPGNIQLKKTAKTIQGCRAYEVKLEVNGTPPVLPIDVVLVLDRSGSMTEATDVIKYDALTNSPGNGTYFTKVNGEYQQLTRYNLGDWWNPRYVWGYQANGRVYYVTWSRNGDDTAPGSTNSNRPTGKPFYTRTYQSRMDLLKQSAINFSNLVLGDGTNGNRVAVTSFSGPSSVSANGAQSQATQDQGFTNNMTAVQNAINGLNAVGGTNTQAGLLQAGMTFNTANRNAKKVTILFTDGLPTASNGNKYKELTDPDTIHYTTAVSAARTLDYTQLFAIGLTAGMNLTETNAANIFLDRVQNAGFFETPNAGDLQEIFDQIYTQLDNYGTSATVEDVLGDDFDLVGSLPQGAVYDAATRKITWKIGVLNGKKELTYRVKAKDSTIGSSNPNDKLPTNKWAKMTFTDVNNNQNQQMDFPVPYVHVPLQLKASLTDTALLLGDSIQLGSGTDGNKMTVTGGTGGYTYEWFVDGESQPFSTDKNPTVTPDKDTKYKVKVTDESGCVTFATMWVRVKTGSLTIHKVDEKDNLIKNNPAVFTLTKDGQVIEEITNADGIATFSQLAKGHYQLVETTAPDRFVKDAAVYLVNVSWVNGQVVVTVIKEGETAPVPSSPLKITNKVQTTSIPVTKEWDDHDNQHQLRPESITIHLYQNNQSEQPFRTLTITPDEQGEWKGTFTDLPRYDADGNLYVYTIQEEPVDHYRTEINGFHILNILETGSLTIHKVDKTDPDNIIPLDGAEFELRLDDGTIAQDAKGNPLKGVTVGGELIFDAIPFGTYKLVETKAPEGYALPNKTWTITIGGDNEQNIIKEIENKQKQGLPSTGGMGTTLFTVIGIGLMSFSAYYLRKNKNKKAE